MKPYNIEIFDRNFNFIYNALVDESDFSYSYDAISPVKNTIPITKDFNPLVLSDEPSAPRGWYIRILNVDIEYYGIITAFESENNINIITYSPLASLFDINIPVTIASGANVIMENFIKNTIERNFKNSTDSKQNVENLNCVTTSSTTGTFNFATKTSQSGFISVNVVNDVISEAVAAGIVTNISIDITNKAVNVSIGKNSDEITVEGDLPNIVNKTFNIKKGNNVVNRFTAYDTYFSSGYEYYLHPDGTFDSQDRDRILPIYNKVSFYSGYDIAKSVIDARIDENNAEIQRLMAYEGTLSDADYAKLNAVNFGTPPTQNGFDFRIGDLASGVDGTGTYINYRNVFNAAKNGNSYTVTTSNPGAIDNTYYFYYYLIKMSGYDGYTFKFTVTFSNFHIFVNGGIPQKQYWKYKQYNKAYVYEVSNPNGSGYAYMRGDIDIPSTSLTPSHVQMNEEYAFTATIQVEYYSPGTSTVVASSSDVREEHLSISTPIYWNDVASFINSYKGSQAYYDEIKASAQAESIHEAGLLAQTAFSSNRYSNLIELTVKADDSMINPLDMEIGQVVNIIHDGVSYNSILSGKEIKGGLVKLIFGTIRLELTKILNMKGV